MQSLNFSSNAFTDVSDDASGRRGLILFGLFLAVAYLLPFHLNPFRAFFNDWLTVFGFAILVMYSLQNQFIKLQLPWISILPTGIAIVILIQAMVGMLSEPWDAFISILYCLAAAIAIILGASIAAAGNGAHKICMSLAVAHLAAGIISVVIALFQFTGHEILFAPFMMLMNHAPNYPMRPHANLGQANHLALLFCISIAAVWWLFQKASLKSSTAVLMILILLCGLTLTQSRIGWIILPIFAVIIQLWNRRTGKSKISWKLICLFLLVYIGMVMALPKIGAALGVTLTPISTRVLGPGEQEFRSQRLELFHQAWQISLANPWFGAGWFQFGPQQISRQELGSSVYSHHAHNILLNFAAELGWPITVLILGVFFYWLYRCCLSRSFSLENGFAILFFIAVIVHSMVEYPLWYAIVLVPFALLVGMVHQEKLGSTKIILSRYYAFAVVLVMSFNLLWIGMDYRRIVAGFNSLEFQAMGIKINNSALQKPSFTVFPYVYNYFKFFSIPVHNKMSKQDIAFMEKVSMRFGGALVLTTMSQVYAMNGEEDKAVNTILTIKRLHPDSRYIKAYEEWRRAPAQYKSVFNRLPTPDSYVSR